MAVQGSSKCARGVKEVGFQSAPGFQSTRRDSYRKLCKPGRYRTSMSQAPRWNIHSANKARRVTGGSWGGKSSGCSAPGTFEVLDGREGVQMHGDIEG